MAQKLSRDEGRLLEKIARRGGDVSPVPVYSVFAEGDARSRELLKKLHRGGYVRVHIPEKVKPSIERELDGLSRRYLESVKAISGEKGTRGFAKARESCLILKECVRRADMERARVKTRLKKLRLKLTEAQVRSRIGERSGKSNIDDLSRKMRRQEALLVFLESLPLKENGGHRTGLIDNLDVQSEELAARCRVGELSAAECKRRREAVNRKRKRLQQIVTSHPVNRRLKTARNLLAELKRQKRLTAQKSRELSL